MRKQRCSFFSHFVFFFEKMNKYLQTNHIKIKYYFKTTMFCSSETEISCKISLCFRSTLVFIAKRNWNDHKSKIVFGNISETRNVIILTFTVLVQFVFIYFHSPLILAVVMWQIVASCLFQRWRRWKIKKINILTQYFEIGCRCIMKCIFVHWMHCAKCKSVKV